MIALIFPTHRCNLRCAHCLRSYYEDDDLELDDLKSFLLGFQENNLGKLFDLTGGEPTLHKNFPSILGLLKEMGFRGTVFTNGQNKEGIYQIIKFSEIIQYVYISLEGPTAFVNDRIRGRGAFKKAMNSIGILKKKGIEVRVRLTLNFANVNFMRPMFLLADLYGIDHLNFSPIMPCAKAEKNQLDISEETLNGAHNIFCGLRKKYPNIKSSFRLNNFLRTTSPEWSPKMCSSVKISSKENGSLGLLPNGDVSFCCDLIDYDFLQNSFGDRNESKLSYVLGNVRRDAFKNILKNRLELIDTLKKRRKEDSEKGRLTGLRQYICENCKFYFHKD
jgi:MoaA/NifB/PqqE/SkfB family radical SAM enzyme